MTVLSEDFLRQARQLAQMNDRRPKQANLRRAISSAYYAVFHLLLWDAAGRLTPASPPDLRKRITRAFAHGEMRSVCRTIFEGQLSPALQQLLPTGFSPALRSVAKDFVALQDERHRADYDLTAGYLRIDTEAVLNRAEGLFAAWEGVRSSDEANVFCAALLLGTRWAK